MNLVVNPPVLPMLAKRVEEVPPEGKWIYEPKWDGFRILVFRDRDAILIQSRDEKSLNRYFPEMIDPLLQQLPSKCVLDGELVIASEGRLDFDALQLRIHPAASRVKLLASQTPASCIFFDLLCKGTRDLRGHSFRRRRAELQLLLKSARPPIHITPATEDRKTALDWFHRFEGAGLDGVVAKPADLPYQSDNRVMLKVKHERDCDCVVAGFRWYKQAEGKQVGSLLLGLYDKAKALQHVGVCSSFTTETRRELLDFLMPYRKNALPGHPWKNWANPDELDSAAEHRMPGGKSRWSQGKDLSWEPLRPELVVEVSYEHMQSGRFRHMAHFRRWRKDRKPATCTFEQLEVVPPEELKAIFASGR
jgi:ATP-dependent DNA ligase